MPALLALPTVLLGLLAGIPRAQDTAPGCSGSQPTAEAANALLVDALAGEVAWADSTRQYLRLRPDDRPSFLRDLRKCPLLDSLARRASLTHVRTFVAFQLGTGYVVAFEEADSWSLVAINPEFHLGPQVGFFKLTTGPRPPPATPVGDSAQQ